MPSRLHQAISRFGDEAKRKLSSPTVTGQPEDQLRAPLESLIKDVAEVCGFQRTDVNAIGESSLSSLKTRPDYAVTIRNALIGFIEVKSPGKGADPRRFRDRHDKDQWQKLQSLPNLIYTDGNSFSLWQDGELQGEVVRLLGDIESSGKTLEASQDLLVLFEGFLRWQPIPPRDPKDLAKTSARLCRLLRDEVTEQLSQGSAALTALATDWRKLLFPEATNAQFADGYAQAVTFGLLMARARGIRLSHDLHNVARRLARSNSLIGTALGILTDDAENQATLRTSLGTLTRVLDVVDWPTISKGDPDAWLYFYEDFLEVYDNELRKKTGSYYTPPEVVGAMVTFVDETLRSRFGLHAGLASPTVTIADPAVGTGTFVLGVLRQIARSVEVDEGEGSVPAAITAAVNRVVAFEMQLGPFAVAQLRILAEISELSGETPPPPPRMFVADTLSDPYGAPGWLPAILAPIAESRRQADQIKRDERITVVIGNPPYKEKAKGRGGWVESGSTNSPERAPLSAWIPPANWGLGAHAKHLRNLYVYFWRWATWKVFDHDPNANTGIVCFITVAGFLNGPGFERMREYLRQTAADIWVIDCSPEGHQPEVSTRIFQGVQQPVCIVLASRPPNTDQDIPAFVRFRSLPTGHRQKKFEELDKLSIDTPGWIQCPNEWRAPFLPASKGSWPTYPSLNDLFIYDGSGVMPGRTWIISPDAESLLQRWRTLINSPIEEKEKLFHPHLSKGKLGDRHIKKVLSKGLPGFPSRPIPIEHETGPPNSPLRYGFRSFDRQWILPDNRLINRPNPELWEVLSEKQIYLTAPSDRSPTSGPAITFTALVPDLHHYNGRGGRVFPLWNDRNATLTNVSNSLLDYLQRRYEREVMPEDFFAYVAAVLANPSFTEHFAHDLVQPGLRVPLTADRNLFFEAVDVGKSVIWLHTFGERFTAINAKRPTRPPRMAPSVAPRIPALGAISQSSTDMPDVIAYDEIKSHLLVGDGYIEHVTPAMWKYEVSGKQVLKQWFSYRKANRERPIIGDRRQPSRLGDIQPDHWLAEYTTELINVLHILGRLIEIEQVQAELLERICTTATISLDELRTAKALAQFDEKQIRIVEVDSDQGTLPI